jgi:hypothetical protein
MFFTFPQDARWNAERQTVEFGVEIGEYQGVVRGPIPALIRNQSCKVGLRVPASVRR